MLTYAFSRLLMICQYHGVNVMGNTTKARILGMVRGNGNGYLVVDGAYGLESPMDVFKFSSFCFLSCQSRHAHQLVLI